MWNQNEARYSHVLITPPSIHEASRSRVSLIASWSQPNQLESNTPELLHQAIFVYLAGELNNLGS
jgi:hypothetical protein